MSNPAEKPAGPPRVIVTDRVNSWHEIATYLAIDEQTARQWERDLGLPVHHTGVGPDAPTHAYKSELDAWWGARLDLHPAPEPPPPPRLPWYSGVIAGIVVFGSIAASVWLLWPDAKETGAWRVRPLTAYPSSEICPALSPDGNQVAFAWDSGRRGEFDLYLQTASGGTPVRLTSAAAPDVSPAWSPDGRWIAFLRLGPFGREDALILIPSTGGEERTLASVLVTYDQSGIYPRLLDWTRDGENIVVGGQSLGSDRIGIVLVSVRSGERRTLVLPPAPPAFDSTPAVSPDGRRLAFIRCATQANCDLWVSDIPRGGKPASPPRRLTFGDHHVTSPAWSPDGREIIVSAGAAWESRSMLRIPAGGGKPVLESAAAPDIQSLSISPTGRLAYSRELFDADVWMMETERPGSKPAAVKQLIASTRMDFAPDLSPDGRRVAFSSNRSGNPEVWLADRTGSNPRQLTHSDRRGAYRPRWSPDGQFIAYALSGSGESAIYVISSAGGSPAGLTPGKGLDTAPGWSRDGRFIYFLSRRGGSRELWKMPSGGESAGPPVQITQGGAAGEAFESLDGRYVYYIATGGGVSMIPAGGGKIRAEGIEGLAGNGTFHPVRDGIYFLAWPEIGRPASLVFLKQGSKQPVVITEVPEPYGTITASADGRTVLYGKVERRESDLMIVENFR